MLTKNPVGSVLRDPKFLDYMIHAGAPDAMVRGRSYDRVGRNSSR